MKILKLLNSSYLSILLIILLISFSVKAEDKPIDIWNLNQNEIKDSKSNNDQKNKEADGKQKKNSSIYDLQSQKENQDAVIELARTESADEAVQKVKTKFELREKELLETQKIMQRNIDDFKEKGTNRSSQILGEAGEVYIEEKLEKLFPNDHISEVKKGERGADCLWTIRSNGRRVASIYCEAKNTQTFQSKWIDKLKNSVSSKQIMD